MHVYQVVKADPAFTSTIVARGVERIQPRHTLQKLYIAFLGLSSFTKRSVYISHTTLQDEAGISASAVKRGIRELVALGYIKIIRRGGTKGRFFDCNRYKVTPPAAYIEAIQKAAAPSAPTPKTTKTTHQRLAIARATMSNVPGATSDAVERFMDACAMERANDDERRHMVLQKSLKAMQDAASSEA